MYTTLSIPEINRRKIIFSITLYYDQCNNLLLSQICICLYIFRPTHHNVPEDYDSDQLNDQNIRQRFSIIQQNETAFLQFLKYIADMEDFTRPFRAPVKQAWQDCAHCSNSSFSSLQQFTEYVVLIQNVRIQNSSLNANNIQSQSRT